MLNKNNERELAYVVYVDEIKPIPGKDRVECARVGGWTCMVPKGAFKPGDPGVYFEIDSKVPTDKAPFEFCAKYKGHIKTQKFKTPEGQFWSQGLLMAAADFGWTIESAQFAGDFSYILDDKGVQHIPGTNSAFLTKQLGIVYYEVEDNKRKASKNPDARINAALARHPGIAKKYGKVIKKNKFLRWFFIFLFGKKRDNRSWIPGVPKTDEERIENRPMTLEASDVKWVATEKIDGTSTTFYYKRGKGFKKPEYLVCSRNVVFDTPTKVDNNFYSNTIGGNVYLEMSEKYKMREALENLLKLRPNAEWVAVQAETFGAGVQKRDYGMKDHEVRAFNLLYSDCGRVGTLEMKDILESFGVPCVPIISTGMFLPTTIDELREFVHSAPSAIDGKMKEGIVFRTLDGVDSFKCVDPEFLVRFHS